MTITNHALTGAIIGTFIGRPELALPLALLSHFLLDMIPHWDMFANRQKLFTRVVGVDMVMATIFGVIVLVLRPDHWLTILACAVLATTPDLLWLPHFLQIRAGKKRRYNRLQHVLEDIQWFQRPIGALVEVAWLAGAVVILTQLLR